MKRKFGKRKTAQVMEIDITSLLDILVILLVFLLKSYNASSLKLTLNKGITLPKSELRKLGAHAVTLQIDQNKDIFENGNKIANINDLSALTDFLEKKRGPASSSEHNINLVFHKDLSYQTIKAVMNTCASSTYSKFKFIVKGNY
ncbi:MAG: biopolymer transporter ExbD [Bacteriovoracaceae bacterium]|jgi:biopolymer transport protein ExbD|nr:biopolymer transporter ExbD [Bacteriovoracaceae bacterium]